MIVSLALYDIISCDCLHRQEAHTIPLGPGQVRRVSSAGENLARFTLKEENLFSLIRLQKLVTHIYHGRLVYFVLLINANIMEIQTKIPPLYFNTRPHLQMSFNLRIFQFVFLGVLVRNTQPRVLNRVKVISKC